MGGPDAVALDWRGILADLRAHLLQPHGTAGAVRGSLRWLEGEMRARGANPAALRNIVYRDIGTPADKAALAGILTDLAREAGRPLPHAAAPTTAPAPLPDELELLGRSKKRAYKQFLASVRAGRTPRMVVTGRRGAGKTVLIEHVASALAALNIPVLRLSLGGDAFQSLSAPSAGAAGRSFAALAAAQAEAARAAVGGREGVLLARVTTDLNFAGEPPRLPDGTPVSPAVWATEHLLRRAPAGLAVLLALEDAADLEAHLPAGVAERIDLHPPTPAEARAYLMARLGIGRAAADALVRETGRNLDRLTLLASVGRGEAGQGESGAARLLADPDIYALAAALAGLSGMPLPAAIPDAVLCAALGSPPAGLPTHARALLSGSPDLGWTPADVLRAALPLVPAAEAQAAARRLVEVFRDEAAAELAGYSLAALTLLQDWPALAAQVSRRPDDARHLPPLWAAIRGKTGRGSKDKNGASAQALETLARALATHHAGRGEYGDPRARDALFTLLESPRDPVRAWARVKLAESSVDAGNFEAARGQLAHPDLSGLLLEPPQSSWPPSSWPDSSWPPSSWTVAAQADALLVQAALARWSGDLEAATRAATDPRTAQGGPRAALWRGLIAKDAGRWPDALSALQSVPSSSPLLSARARYQEGDLYLRLGQPAAALHALQDAAERLPRAGASAEETARVLARAATAQRRLGHPAEGLELLGQALGLISSPLSPQEARPQEARPQEARPQDSRPREDALPRARLLSEGLPILLALGRPDEALAQAAAALNLLSGLLTVPGSRQAEAEYRLRRTQYRLALAYLTRGIGLPYLYPFCGPRRDHPDLAQARTLLDRLLRPAAELSGTDEPDREQVLTFDMLLTRALADPAPDSALHFAERALAMTDHPYAAAQAHAIRAEAHLRADQTGAALADINRAHAFLRRVSLGGEAGSTTPAADPGLAAQLLALEVRATIGEGAGAVLWLRTALQDPALHPFRAGVWREAGRALEAHHPAPERVLQQMYSASSSAHVGALRIRDRLWVLESETGLQD
jgi:tetratricopeptide (TPR) repeat protein